MLVHPHLVLVGVAAARLAGHLNRMPGKLFIFDYFFLANFLFYFLLFYLYFLALFFVVVGNSLQ